MPKLRYSTICIVVNGEIFQCHTVSLTMMGKCPMWNSSEILPYTIISFKLIDHYFLGKTLLSTQTTHTQTETHTATHTDRHEYSMAVLDKPQL